MWDRRTSLTVDDFCAWPLPEIAADLADGGLLREETRWRAGRERGNHARQEAARRAEALAAQGGLDPVSDIYGLTEDYQVAAIRRRESATVESLLDFWTITLSTVLRPAHDC